MKLSLGPVAYYWSREELLDFYERIAATPVDIIYLGETVCSKRRPLRLHDWMEVGEKLQAAGKEVVLSTLSLLEAESELNTLRRQCANGRFPVEANDMSAVQLLSGKGPFIAGPTVNIYNEHTLEVLARLGLKRWVMPVELSQATLADLQSKRPAGMETEVFAFGRLPLAISARCFTAHYHDRPKDDCEFICKNDPEGILLTTQEDAPFLTINGVQLQSAQPYNLLPELASLESLGVDILRLSPTAHSMERVIGIFHDCMHGTLPVAEGQRALQEIVDAPLCNGYWHGDSGIKYVQAQGANL